ncbi:MAG: type II secretion system protein [Alphaproteobacteria bacterium]|nr:type II secretion system protein [Alphaproteobacteria bacterium]
MQKERMKTTQGFSLVELSIVMVVIGLIVGGVLAGREIIRNAEVNSVAAELAAIETGIFTFESKYNLLPGDLNIATTYWPAVTANGDGNGFVDDDFGIREDLLAWQHMALAGVMRGNYTGVADPAFPPSGINPGVNAPTSKIIASSFTLQRHIPPVDDYNGVYGQFVRFAGQTPTGTLMKPLLNPSEAKRIDAKTDDGNSETGDIIGYNGTGGSGNCTTAGNYNVANNGPSCCLHWWTKYQ